MIVGTAGHVDHGKSALVEALTGRRVDRLAEERRRGLTIELNFAPLEFGSRRCGVVDVPGHEDLVATMAAGASGMDVVLLVVAADEGIRPQTLEHRAVLEALRVPRGIPVITRADLVEPSQAEAIAGEVAAWLKDSPVEFDPPAVVSARSGQGLDALRARLAALAEEPGRTGAEGLFRLHVDRVFLVAGAGTVVTGSVVSGTVRRGDRVALLPGVGLARVRAVQAFGAEVESAGPGERIGLALAMQQGVARRGLAVVSADTPWRESRALDVRIEPAPGGADPPHGARVRILAGTAEVLARIRRRSDRPGLARLALESPIAARGGDRFVVRSYSPVATLGGGVVLDPDPPLRGPWPDGLGSPNPVQRVLALAQRRSHGVAPVDLPVLAGIDPGVPAEDLAREAGLVAASARLLHPAAVDEAGEAILRALAAGDPVPLAVLRSLPRHRPEALGEALGRLEVGRRLFLRGGSARLVAWPTEASSAARSIAARIEAAGLAAPDIEELGRPVVDLLEAEQAGLVHRVDRQRWLGALAARRLHSILQELAGEGEINPARLRERTGLSRKYLIPLLE
ncbi:MAG TPA: selenocysteine-specific translation elongation factor, partial [Gemmatimonadales bacterium]|nr:selenocysteine-specific translation elongation factor [Gemmatimonadales bacterium]